MCPPASLQARGRARRSSLRTQRPHVQLNMRDRVAPCLRRYATFLFVAATPSLRAAVYYSATRCGKPHALRERRCKLLEGDRGQIKRDEEVFEQVLDDADLIVQPVIAFQQMQCRPIRLREAQIG